MLVKTPSWHLHNWKQAITIGFASVFYLGYSPIASGTVGSVPGLFAAYWLSPYPVLFPLIILVLFGLGVAASTYAEKFYEKTDPGEVTIDEFVGMLIALLWLPAHWQVMVMAFFLFRIFDILKPFPAYQLQALPGGFGIMSDDVVAGIYANLSVRLLLLIFSLLHR